ncbi:hypothetical protein CAR_c15440 [Carnobacterium sp. 17-4]|uniref:glycosyltransferase family 4 protein n=1 Tax=Carnobacterium sp. (strain 17-4) TaxID=208596 RepID=UPI0002058DE9|nr:glycosyltransferase family 4 protein [Carnobacterium sp. 17-4]AEB30203.1 hypothetical protein CAR_c15440 [Carnobacterium sp. 17-4]
MKKLLYVRSGPYELDFNNYNLQEIGLATAFCKKGYDCDVVYYSKENKDQLIKVGNNSIRILWRKGIKILRSGIYPQILNKDFLSQYDIVIVSEYSQIMSILISYLKKDVYLYNGPYYNLFKIPFVEKVYDKLFIGMLKKNVKKTFVKSELSKVYLDNKGLNDSLVIGVGLDIKKYEMENKVNEETKKLINKMINKRNLLYVGSLIERKNFGFLIKVFQKIKQTKNYKDLQLIIIGKGNKRYIDSCLIDLSSDEKKSVIIFDFIENGQLKNIYPLAEIFLLPSTQEIFGMVMLESMYFRTPVISSLNGGSGTLIKSGYNGIIENEFDITKWVNSTINLLENKEIRGKMGESAHETVKDKYLWDSICEKMIINMDASI